MLVNLGARAAPAAKRAAAGPRARTLADMVKAHRAGGSSGAAARQRTPDVRAALDASKRSRAAAGAANPLAGQRPTNSQTARRTAARVSPKQRGTIPGTRAAATTTPASSGRMGRFAKGAGIAGAAGVGAAWATNTGPGSTPGSQNLYRKPPGGRMM